MKLIIFLRIPSITSSGILSIIVKTASPICKTGARYRIKKIVDTTNVIPRLKINLSEFIAGIRSWY